MSADTQKHVISILLANEAGVLSRVAGLFSARGYNIESLTVAPTTDSRLSRITIVTIGGDNRATQIVKNLHKLIDVVEAVDLGKDKHIEAEVVLVKVACPDGRRKALDEFVEKHGVRIVECCESLCVIEMTAAGRTIDAFILALEEAWDVKEIARSGTISLGNGNLILGI